MLIFFLINIFYIYDNQPIVIVPTSLSFFSPTKQLSHPCSDSFPLDIHQDQCCSDFFIWNSLTAHHSPSLLAPTLYPLLSHYLKAYPEENKAVLCNYHHLLLIHSSTSAVWKLFISVSHFNVMALKINAAQVKCFLLFMIECNHGVGRQKIPLVIWIMSHRTEKYFIFSLMLIFLHIDFESQCHSDIAANVEICFDALPPTYKQCDFAILEE